MADRMIRLTIKVLFCNVIVTVIMTEIEEWYLYL